MEQRIIQYVSYLKGIYLKEYDDEERKKICEQVLVQIGFFQHERLIHLYFGKFCTDDVSLL